VVGARGGGRRAPSLCAAPSASPSPRPHLVVDAALLRVAQDVVRLVDVFEVVRVAAWRGERGAGAAGGWRSRPRAQPGRAFPPARSRRDMPMRASQRGGGRGQSAALRPPRPPPSGPAPLAGAGGGGGGRARPGRAAWTHAGPDAGLSPPAGAAGANAARGSAGRRSRARAPPPPQAPRRRSAAQGRPGPPCRLPAPPLSPPLSGWCLSAARRCAFLISASDAPGSTSSSL